MDIKIIARNRKAKFEYFLLETFEAGIELKGSEIKSIRAGQVSLTEAYIRVDAQQAWLVNANIAPYEQANRYNHDPIRERRLLLHKREIRMLWDSIRQKGVTVIPTKMYLKGGRAKLEIAIAKGKKLYDKRREIAKRDEQRDMERQSRIR
ncbi:MAG: SsrA-binding protein SmpB [Anaerolineaceae bacterium]|jgi:SsrA-binding protein|nr:SsrA-binding protein SmpB [Anaerolineaceae bacterium]